MKKLSSSKLITPSFKQGSFKKKDNDKGFVLETLNLVNIENKKWMPSSTLTIINQNSFNDPAS